MVSIGIPMVASGFNWETIGKPWETIGEAYPIVFQFCRFLYGGFQVVFSFNKASLWFSNGFNRDPYVFFNGFNRDHYGFPLVSIGIPMVFQWFQ